MALQDSSVIFSKESARSQDSSIIFGKESTRSQNSWVLFGKEATIFVFGKESSWRG